MTPPFLDRVVRERHTRLREIRHRDSVRLVPLLSSPDALSKRVFGTEYSTLPSEIQRG